MTNDEEIDKEIYEFMRRSNRRIRNGTPLPVPQSKQTRPVLPQYPDPDRGNEAGWKNAANQQTASMVLLKRKHDILNKIAIGFWIFVCVALIAMLIGVVK